MYVYVWTRFKKAESKTRAWAAGEMVEFEERETVEEREEKWRVREKGYMTIKGVWQSK